MYIVCMYAHETLYTLPRGWTINDLLKYLRVLS